MRKLKRILSLIIATVICTCTLAVYADSSAPELSALKSGNVLLMDALSNRVLYEKNSSGKIAPGGFTKILTAIIVIENVNDINEVVTADSVAVNEYDFSYNNMGVLPYERMTVKDMLIGLMIYDAGEAANALAVHVSGSMETFVEKMNSTAASLGCKSSKFTNPSGIPDDGQYSTLKDIALIVNHAMKNTVFAEIAGTASHSIAPSNKYRETRHLNNTNKFVNAASPYYNEFVTGVKTSYVSNKDCGIAITYVNKNTSLLCLISNAPYENGVNYANEDAKNLISYGTDYYVAHKVMSKDDIMAEVKVPNGKEASRVLLVAPNDLIVNLPKGFSKEKLEVVIKSNEKVKAPIAKGDVLGQVTVMYNGEEYASTVLVADTSLKSSGAKAVINGIVSFFTSWIFITVIILIIVLFVVYTILLNKAKRKKSYVSRFR